MAAKFPSITYSNLTTHIANTIVSLVSNIGNKYNNLPAYHTNSIYQRLQTVEGNNMSMVWDVWLDGNNPNYDRKVYDHSQSNVTTIKQELDTYLRNNGVANIDSVIEQGSFLGLVHNLITFISNRIVIHTSQEDNGSKKYVCYDSYITDDLIKNDTKMAGESNVVSVPPGGQFKLVDDIDFKRVIDSLTRLIKKPYRFSGTYYNFDLLSGEPGSPIALVIHYFGAGSEAAEIDSKTVFEPDRTWRDGETIQNYSITTLNQTTNYRFVGWKKCTISADKTPTQGGNYSDTEATVSSTKLTLKSSYLWTSGNPNDGSWHIACIFAEKTNNDTTFTLSDNGGFTKKSDGVYSCNMIGKDSVTYNGCKVTTANNTNAIQYSVSSTDGDFSINASTGAVTCRQPGTAVVSIKQNYTLTVKPYSNSYTLEVVRNKLQLTSSLFTFSAPSDKTGGKPASFLAKVEGIGTSRTIRYSNDYVNDANPGTWSTEIPTEAGKWYCKIECDEGTKYLSGEVFDPSWSYTITPPEPPEPTT